MTFISTIYRKLGKIGAINLNFVFSKQFSSIKFKFKIAF